MPNVRTYALKFIAPFKEKKKHKKTTIHLSADFEESENKVQLSLMLQEMIHFGAFSRKYSELL